MRIGRRIVIESRQVGSVGGAEGLIHGGSKTGVARIGDHEHTRAARLRKPNSAVVHNHHFIPVERLTLE